MVVEDAARRFSGLERLYGVDGARRIRASHVVVVGVGGVGSWTVEALARSGIGRLTLIDLDHISESNINRQVHALESTIGRSKVLAMQERISQINPDCTVFIVDDFVDPENWQEILEQAEKVQGRVTAVVDACDQPKAKLAMSAWAISDDRLFIVVGAAGGKRHASRVEIDDIAFATHDPLIAGLRQRLRKDHDAPRDGKKIGVACVFSRESVALPDASCAVAGDGSLNCSGYGSIVSVTATFGFCAAGWVMDRVASTDTL